MFIDRHFCFQVGFYNFPKMSFLVHDYTTYLYIIKIHTPMVIITSKDSNPIINRLSKHFSSLAC